MEGTDRDDRKPLKLNSPAGGEPLVFHWSENPKQSCALEIIDTVRVASTIFPELRLAIEKNIKLDSIDITSYDEIRQLCKRFSKACHSFAQLHTGSAKERDKNAEYASVDLLRHICTKAYNRAVDNEKALNKHYEAFSSQTYGETSFERLQMIIEEVRPTEDDVFVDLGSGVGQLVVHMAGGSKVKKAVGIEIAQLPAKFGETLEIEFKKWMRWFGKKFRPFQLERGDFLDHKYRDTINQDATIIFINNFAFQADLETRIKRELLSELKNGTRIISTKPYGSLNKNQLTDRDLNDISAIVDITELRACQNPCSWTSAYVPYYLHVINRAKLEHYFLTLKNPSLRRSVTPSSRNSSNRNSRESSVVSFREYKNGHRMNGDDSGYGPTTRRRWNHYVSELEQKRKKSDYDDDMEQGAKEEMFSPTHSEEGTTEDTTANDPPYGSPISSPTVMITGKKRSKLPKESRNATRGRPRKNPLAPPREKHRSPHIKARLSNDAKEALEEMHKMTCNLASMTPSTVVEPSFILTDLKSLRNNRANSAADNFIYDVTPGTSNVNHIGNEIKPMGDMRNRGASKYPKLDKFIDDIRTQYENFLDNIQTPEFVQDLTNKLYEKIKAESSRVNINELDRTSKEQVTLGANILREQMRNFGIDTDRPTRVLEISRRIVAQYKRVQQKCDELENELNVLNMETEQLVAAHQREQQKQQEKLLQRELFAANAAIQQVSAMFPTVPSIDQLLLSDLAHIQSQQVLQQQLANPMAAAQLGLVNNDMVVLQNVLRNLGVGVNQTVPSQLTPPTNDLSQLLNTIDLNNPLFAELTSRVLAESNHASQQQQVLLNTNSIQSSALLNAAHQAHPVIPQTLSMPSSSSSISQQHIDASINSIISSPTFNTNGMPFSPTKRGRGRTNKLENRHHKKSVQGTVQETAKHPNKHDEIEKQVQTIVAKAMEVENAVKSAEKERKSRGSGNEKKKPTLTLTSGCIPITPIDSPTVIPASIHIMPQVEPLTPPSSKSKRSSSDAGFSPLDIGSLMPPPPMPPRSMIGDYNSMVFSSLSASQSPVPKFVSCLATIETSPTNNLAKFSVSGVQTQFVSCLANLDANLDELTDTGGPILQIPQPSSSFSALSPPLISKPTVHTLQHSPSLLANNNSEIQQQTSSNPVINGIG